MKTTENDDGYRYGVRFGADSPGALNIWSGSAQRARAEETAHCLSMRFRSVEFTVVRRRPGGDWEPIPETAQGVPDHVSAAGWWGPTIGRLGA